MVVVSQVVSFQGVFRPKICKTILFLPGFPYVPCNEKLEFNHSNNIAWLTRYKKLPVKYFLLFFKHFPSTSSLSISKLVTPC